MTDTNVAETVFQDLSYALRTMRKNPVLTTTVVVTLALGIGGNTAAFSVVRTLLLKPLQFGNPDQLVEITVDYPRRELWDTTFSKQQFDKLKSEQQSFAAMGVALGRGFLPEEETPAGAEVAMLSNQLWRRKFNATRPSWAKWST
ncbi:MAG: hypothetical protein JO097_01335 [Acidobacteriaceae bacterium]|nr:hypothetical protein [Acidobacteriaceae bacterium]MBV9296292.1 hypothetical protein [Acidobacteriaceae bacterium]MBV9766252.1 hypothetical protein [Acidobacteriaceae bacterium]